MRRLGYALLIGVVIGVIGAALGLSRWGLVIERDLALPLLFDIRGEIEPPPDILIVAINNSTAQEMGLPSQPRDWPRSTHGRLIENLVAGGASVIVFDVFFAHEESPEDDRAFADAIADAGRVILYEMLDARITPIKDQQGVLVLETWGERPIPPFDLVARAARGLAPFPLPKEKIAVSTFWAFKESANDLPTIPAMVLQLRSLDLYQPWLSLLEQVGAPGADGLPRHPRDLLGADRLRDLMRQLRRAFKADPELKARILEVLEKEHGSGNPAENRRRLAALAGLYGGPDVRYLNFYGYPGQITTIDYHLLLKDGGQGTGGASIDLTDKVVFVGASDIYFAEQPDRFFTAFTNKHGIDLSGVEIMATAFGNLLTDRSLRTGDTLTTMVMLSTFGLALGVAVYLLPALPSVLLAIILTAGLLLGVAHSFVAADLWLPAAVPALIQFPLAVIFGLAGQYLIELRKEQQVTKAIGYYLPDHIVKDLSERGLESLALNQVVNGTCLASDMSGFTTISEKMQPEALADFMNDYFESLSKPLKRHDVDVTEFHADSIMCAWTATDSGAAAREKAILAALEVAEAIGHFAERHAPLRLNARIGLEDGRFYLGHTGGGGRFAYSILGDCPNTASRLEGLNNHLGTHILATESVVANFDDVLTRPLGWFQVAGKSDPSPVVEILAMGRAASKTQRLLCERFAEALDMFRAQRWTRAAVLFRAIARDYPDDGPAAFYLDRCQAYRTKAPPPEAAGIIRMDVK